MTKLHQKVTKKTHKHLVKATEKKEKSVQEAVFYASPKICISAMQKTRCVCETLRPQVTAKVVYKCQGQKATDLGTLLSIKRAPLTLKWQGYCVCVPKLPQGREVTLPNAPPPPAKKKKKKNRMSVQ